MCVYGVCLVLSQRLEYHPSRLLVHFLVLVGPYPHNFGMRLVYYIVQKAF